MKMLKKLRLKVVLILLAIVGICVPSILVLTHLVHQYEDMMIANYVSTVDNELARIADSIDSYLQTNVVRFSESCLNDKTLHEIMQFENFEETEDIQHDYLVKEYILNAYFGGRFYFNTETPYPALLINETEQVYNLAYPYNLVDSEDPFIRDVLGKESKNYIRINWYGLMEDRFRIPSSDPREQLVIPITRNLIHPGSQHYSGKMVFLLPERALCQVYSKSSLMDGNQIYLLDNQSRLLSHSNLDTLQNGREEPIQVQPGLHKEDQEYVTAKTLNVNGWTLVCEASLEHIYHSIDEHTGQYIQEIVLLLLVVCALITVAAHELTAPVYALMNSMHRASQKDFSGVIPEKGTKDMIELVRNFNTLLADMDDLIYREYEIKRQKQQAELDVLITQINPHFLYNTLESIVWQARAAGAVKVADMAHYLGELFNLTVNKGKPMMTVSKELSHVEMYVKLQNMRYNDRIDLRVSWDDEELLEKQTLKLMLQPIVENAILHGMDPDQEHFTIYIHVEEDENQIVFYIEDNGVGIEEEQLRLINQKLKDPAILYDMKSAEHNRQVGNGIGVLNVHQRIRLYYGNQYGVKVESTLHQGTCVEIHIPDNS